MTVGAVALGAASETLAAVPATSVRRGADVVTSVDRCAVVRGDRDRDRAHRAIPDGNRSAVLPDVRVARGGREWMLGVKGIGAAAPLFGVAPIDDALASDFGRALGSGDGLIAPRTISGESWMGEAPYGAQGEEGAEQALEVTALADERGSISGAWICPVIAAVEIPDAHVDRDVFWYRRHRGPFLQEHRLVPSDVRLFHGSERALARDPERVLEGMGIRDVAALDPFLDRFLASGLAALTLWARTAREREGSWEGLDFDDAWLDKDSVIARDGTIFLVDLEALAWSPATARIDVEARIRRQIDRNAYELFYGADALLDVRDRWLDRASSAQARREALAVRIALALAGDAHASVIESSDGIDVAVRAPARRERVSVRLIDRR